MRATTSRQPQSEVAVQCVTISSAMCVLQHGTTADVLHSVQTTVGARHALHVSQVTHVMIVMATGDAHLAMSESLKVKVV